MISRRLKDIEFFPCLFLYPGGELMTTAFECDCGYILPSPEALGPGWHTCECPECTTVYPFNLYAVPQPHADVSLSPRERQQLSRHL